MKTFGSPSLMGHCADAPQDVRGPWMIRKKRCWSSTSVCRGSGCFSAEINPFLLRTKAVEKEVQNKPHGKFCMGLFFFNLLIFSNFLKCAW